jgi:hypothetical protein
VKSIALQKAINVIKMDSWTSPVDFRYQDETSQFKMQADRIAAQKRGEVYVPKPWEGLLYLAKDDLGKVHVRGFLHNEVAQNGDGTFCHPGTLSTPELLQRLSKAWKAHARKNRETQISHQRLVFSVSKEFHDAIAQAGRNPDMVLRGAIERTMRAFQEKFHPGDSVGYSYGLHHDTDNLHAHVFLHPRTRDGNFVGMSGKPRRHQGHDSRHKDQLGFVHETVRRHVTRVLKELSNPKEAAHLKNNFHSDRIFYVPRVSHLARTKRNLQPLVPADAQFEQKRAVVVAFDRQIAKRRAAIREAVSGRRIVGSFRMRQPKWLRHLQAAQTATLFRELRQLQQQRYRAVSDYWTSRRISQGITRAAAIGEPTTLAATPVIKIRSPKPTLTVKPAVRNAKPHRRN